MNEEMQKQVTRLQMMEQSFNHLTTQISSLNSELNEINMAKHEVSNTESAFQIIGSVLVKKDSKSLIEDLENKNSLITSKLDSLKQNQELMSQKIKSLQKEVYEELNKSAQNETVQSSSN